MIALEGVTHAQFLSGTPPLNVRLHDLKPDVSEAQAHEMIATAMVQYFDQIIFGRPQSIDVDAS